MTDTPIKFGHTPEGRREPSLVPPIIAAIASLIIPGLEQVLARATRRGIILFATMISMVFLMAWRFQLAAPRDTGWVNITKKGFHLDPFLIGRFSQYLERCPRRHFCQDGKAYRGPAAQIGELIADRRVRDRGRRWSRRRRRCYGR